MSYALHKITHTCINVGMLVLATIFTVATAEAAPSDATLLEEVTPPSRVIEGQPMDAPEILIKKDRSGKLVEEYRVNGELYLIKVTLKSGKSYYLHRHEKNGTWTNIGPNPPLSVPQWVLFRF